MHRKPESPSIFSMTSNLHPPKGKLDTETSQFLPITSTHNCTHRPLYPQKTKPQHLPPPPLPKSKLRPPLNPLQNSPAHQKPNNRKKTSSHQFPNQSTNFFKITVLSAPSFLADQNQKSRQSSSITINSSCLNCFQLPSHRVVSSK